MLPRVTEEGDRPPARAVLSAIVLATLIGAIVRAVHVLAFDFPLRIERTASGAKFFGKQVRREGPERRFVYVRVGQAAGQWLSEWNRRMKIDIHDIDPALLDKAIAGGVLEATIDGTLPDGSPACATIRPVRWQVA